MFLIELEWILCAYPNKDVNHVIFESFKAIVQGTIKTLFITHFSEVMTYLFVSRSSKLTMQTMDSKGIVVI